MLPNEARQQILVRVRGEGMSDTNLVLLLPAAARDDAHLHELATASPPQRSAAVQLPAGKGEQVRRRLAAFSGHRISRFACAFALLILDLFLIGGIGVLAGAVGVPATWDLSGRSSAEEILMLVFAPVAAVLSLWRERAYAMEGAGPHPSAVAIGWLNAAGLVVLGIYAFDALSTSHLPHRDGVLSPLSLIAFVVTGGAAVLGRNALWLVLRPRVLPQLAKNPAVVAGAGAGLFAFVEILERKSETTQIVAVVSNLDSGTDEVLALVRDGIVRTVFIVLSTADADAADPLLAKLAAFPVAVRIVPDITGIAARSCGISLEAGLPVLHISDPPLSPAAAFVKRMEDIVLSSLLLLATAPIMPLAIIAIKLESRGPVLFRQPRDGLNGSTIEVFKFRTMYAHLEDRLASRQTLRGDPRVTRVGAFLRRHSLDELPQLFNVLGGTLSLVGPRPHPPAITAGGQHLELVADNYMARHRMKPGITGWAQVSGCRGNLDTVEKAVRRVEHDLYYIENWSVLLDLLIIVRTIGVVLHDDQAF
jgi:Undecaprenyl-phosphate glucose phosphotransferase